MAYVRWSSVIGGEKTWVDFFEAMQKENKPFNYRELRELELQQEGAYPSDWYIFWSEDYSGQEEPILACWNAKCKGSPNLTKEEVEYLLENKNYKEIFGDEVTQIEVLEKYMYAWLSDLIMEE